MYSYSFLEEKLSTLSTSFIHIYRVSKQTFTISCYRSITRANDTGVIIGTGIIRNGVHPAVSAGHGVTRCDVLPTRSDGMSAAADRRADDADSSLMDV